MVTVTEVRAGSAEQPVEIHLKEFPGRPYKPNKSMRRVLLAAWGKETSAYAGRRLRLYGDPEVRFGGSTVGGIKISHLSHIKDAVKLSLTATRGKRAQFVVQPLPDDAPTSPIVSEEVVARLAELRQEWKDANPERRKEIETEVAELEASS